MPIAVLQSAGLVMIDQPEAPNPERLRLEVLVGMAAKRLARADEKLNAAHQERGAARRAHDAAIERLAAWDEANPDPQLALI